MDLGADLIWQVVSFCVSALHRKLGEKKEDTMFVRELNENENLKIIL